MRCKGWVFLLAAWAVGAPAPASANDPNTTVTIYVHGFGQSDADRSAVYGETIHEALIDSVAALVGLPIVEGTDSLPPNATLAVGYNGDTPPSYYSPTDVAEVDGITAQWGGGVPRYAAIVAKYARHVLQRSGAEQLNFVSGSFGSLIVRWLIEKDIEGLAGEGRIARWLTAEGLVAGNWAASRDGVADFLDFLQLLPIEVQQMDYEWVESHLHAPRIEADNPLYAGILVGQVASTDDSYQDGALSTLMAGYGEFQPNDGVQALRDAYFHLMTPESRLLGMEPTLGLFHVNHYELSHDRGAWAEAATFITQRRRVRVVMTSATVSDMHEAHQPFWDWRPAEVVFGSRAYSPAVQARWGIGDPLSTVGREGAAAPLRRYNDNGETQNIAQVVFDDLVLDEETQLRLELHAEEIDYDLRYGVYETIGDPYDDLGSGTIAISTLVPGTYTFHAPSWSCELSVGVFNYPFGLPLGVMDAAPSGQPGRLSAAPNPHSSMVRIALAGPTPGAQLGPATLNVFDLSGRYVRGMRGDVSAGFLWDGRDGAGVPVPAGVYLYRVETPARTWFGRSCLMR